MKEKTKEQYRKELEELQKAHNSLKATVEKEQSIKKGEDSILKKLILSSQEFIQFTDDDPDYKKILQVILDISGAKYAALNVFDEDGLDFTTVAIAGIKENIQKGLNILGFDIQNKHWNHDPVRAEKTKKQSITRFMHLHELTGDVIPKNIVSLLENTFRVKESFIVKVVKDNKVLGDFTLMFEKGKTLKNSSYVELYANQVGLFLDRMKSQQFLKESEVKLRNILENTTSIFYSHNTEHVLTYVSPQIKDMLGYSQEEAMIKWTELVSDNPINEIGYQHTVKAIKTGKPQPVYNLELVKKSGEKIWVEVRETPVVENCKVLSIVGSITDVTEKRKAEQALMQSEEKYRLLAENASDVIWVLNLTKEKFTFISPSVFALRGYTPEEAMQQDISQSLSPESAKIVERGISERLPTFLSNPTEETKKVYLDELRQPCKNGSSIWIETSTRYQFNSANEVEVIGISRSIEKRKQAEEEIWNKQFLLRTIIDNIPDAISTKDIDLRKTLCNSADLHNIGAESESEVLGKDDFDLFPKEIAKKFYADDKYVIEKGKSLINREEVLLNKDGQKRWLLTSKIPLRDTNDKIIGLIVIGRDITERKKTEQALKESEEKHKRLFKNSNSLIWEVDADSYEIVSCNPPMARVFRKDINEIIGKKVHEILPPEFAEKTIKLGTEALLKNKVVKFEYEINGRHFLINFISYIEGNHKLVQSVVYDITEQKRAEITINQQRDELLKLNADKDRFISIIGHDLRSPFNSLLGFSELLSKNSRKYDSDKIEKLATNIHKSAQHSYNLLDDLLQWARAEQGNIAFEPQNLNLTIVCNDALETLAPIAKEKSINISTQVEDKLKVFGDANMLKTVLRNLVSNAIKFTGSGGVIDIKAEMDAENVVIAVRDNGIGIPSDVLPKLFDITEKISTSGTSGETGTGLGLLLCKEFVEKHGGRIWAESEEGKGSEFVFTLKNQ